MIKKRITAHFKGLEKKEKRNKFEDLFLSLYSSNKNVYINLKKKFMMLKIKI